MKIYEQSSQPVCDFPSVQLVHGSEAEQIIENLETMGVAEVGSDKFLRQYGVNLERCSMQAHASAASNSEEFVVDSILSFSKFSVLTETLLAVEAWRVFVLPKLKSKLAENKNCLRIAFTLHVETTIVGLLNLALYKRESCGELESECAVALVDYCARCMSALAVPLSDNKVVKRQKIPESTPYMEYTNTSKTCKSNESELSPLKEIEDMLLDTEFRTYVASTSLARYLCEYIDEFPLSVQTRILDTHDFLMMIIPLIDEPPWTRRRIVNGTRIWEKLVDNQWTQVPPSELLQCTKCEAQCWFTVYFLTCSDQCRKQYGLNAFRKGQLLRLRKYLNEVMLDQLPVLTDLTRYIDELSLLNVPENATGHGSALLMQELGVMRDRIIRKVEWNVTADEQFNEIFSRMGDIRDPILREISGIYGSDEVGELVGHQQNSLVNPLSHEFDNATLSIEEESRCSNFNLRAVEGTDDLVKTEHGMFRRIKLTAIPHDGHEACLCSSARISLQLSYVGLQPFNKKVESNFSFPKKSHNDGSAKTWCQLGSLKEKVVLQICFVRNAGVEAFSIGHLYLSCGMA
uniref:Uncharacterized protein n=1 Tax=Leptocylindrus danicus TaxID=163516 RepID=A0A7S2LHJ0_9STRA|mmetsp:Transcript_575/g.770  ORF Transcript_575/g.770 Transcript_575/m.770 type:complete len:574 (+) Transcript_575:223-1944(+)|eukprot:CAMPEP_0116010110 /NCGR_PEP_ID=MMETSP0321-20121206/3816_1 /TAXON_ID=163516 /ORGANISM="Leptocylindrus danicus var. danicus, Strain B650" /LENGTH=573 /DNA_ID=CAMNT_0003479167 /DNA_START=148 /DNA_END=1869 /DNA_ORIENTATION=+